MRGGLHQYLSDDHVRLDQLLRRAVANPPAVDMSPYAEFRKGLLRHIGIEEKIVFPLVARAGQAEIRRVIDKLRLEHGALVSLLVPPPTKSIVATIQTILDAHNPLEEDEGGLYDILEECAGSDPEMLRRLESAPDVPVLPHNTKPGVLDATRRAVERAGYVMKREM